VEEFKYLGLEAIIGSELAHPEGVIKHLRNSRGELMKPDYALKNPADFKKFIGANMSYGRVDEHP